MDESYFVDWQKAKVQENPDEVRECVWGGGSGRAWACGRVACRSSV